MLQQPREPLHTRCVGKWMKYPKAYLEPLLRGLSRGTGGGDDVVEEEQ